MEFDSSRQVTLRRSKAGGALLIYDEAGNSFMCPCALVTSLIAGKANGNMVKANYIGGTNPQRFNSNLANTVKVGDDLFDPSKIRQVDGDPLDYKANLERQSVSVKVVGDDW